MGRYLASFMIAVGIAVICAFGVSAESTSLFSFRFQASSAKPGETVKLVLSANQNSLEDNIAGFRILLNYDEDKLIFKRADTADQIKSGTFFCQDWGGRIMGTYVCDGKSAPKLTGDCISFVFSARDNVSGKAQVSAEVYEIVDWSEKFLEDEPQRSLAVSIQAPDPADAFLTYLEPSVGALSPPFSSDTYSYSLNVDSSVTSVDFDTAATGASVKVSRRTLQKAGEDTRIVITVTSEDKSKKTEYVVTVHRALPVASEPETISSETGAQEPGSSSESALSNASKIESRQNSDSEPTNGSSRPANAEKEMPRKSNNPGPITGETVPSLSRTVNVYGDRNLYVVSNQMDAFAAGILVALFCMLLGGILLPFLKKKPK